MKKLIFLFLLISMFAQGQTTKKRWKAFVQKAHLSDVKTAWGWDTSYISGSGRVFMQVWASRLVSPYLHNS